MNQLVYLTIIGFLSGTVGTGIGGISAFFIKGESRRGMSFLLEFAAGLMISIVCFDLLPESFKLGSLIIGIFGIILGIGTIIFVDEILKIINRKGKAKNAKKNLFTRTGILLLIGIALHNFPEGVAVGSCFNVSTVLGFSLAGIISLHDIPEGLAIAATLKAGGMKSWKAIFLTILSGVPTGIGAFFGVIVGKISDIFISMSLGFAGGAMLYIVLGELIPQSNNLHRGRLSTMGCIIGIILGIIITFNGR